MSDDHGLTSLSKIIPTLTGTDNYVKWRRALESYLLDKGALRVLKGTETEPYRVRIEPHDDERDGEFASLKPPGPADQALGTVATSTTGHPLTATQKAQWDAWEAKERKARSTLILTISPALAAELEHLWSANDIYTRIQAEHNVNTVERRGELLQRLILIRLHDNAPANRCLSITSATLASSQS